MPPTGDLFPKIKREDPKHRAAEFRRRFRTLKIKGRMLHSYRYAWAHRAKAAGMPERNAMNHLGHKSRAIHAAYSGAADVAVLPLEYYEEQQAKNIIEFGEGQRRLMHREGKKTDLMTSSYEPFSKEA